MDTHRLHSVIMSNLEAVMAAEKITRKALGELSRDLLTYVVESHDIAIVNRLIGALTPVNKRVSILYFQHFLPWQVEQDTKGEFVAFGKMKPRGKKHDKQLEAVKLWLADETNTIWSWSDDNIDLNKKKDFQGMISKAIKKALEGDAKSDTDALTMAEVLTAIMAGGVSVEALLDAATTTEETPKEEAQAPVEEALAA